MQCDSGSIEGGQPAEALLLRRIASHRPPMRGKSTDWCVSLYA